MGFAVPIRSQAIRVRRNDYRRRKPYRVTQIIARDVDGNKIPIAGAHTDDYRGWRKSTAAPQLYDGRLGPWRRGNGVHFSKWAIIWFDKEVTIKSLELVQFHANADWRWEQYNPDSPIGFKDGGD